MIFFPLKFPTLKETIAEVTRMHHAGEISPEDFQAVLAGPNGEDSARGVKILNRAQDALYERHRTAFQAQPAWFQDFVGFVLFVAVILQLWRVGRWVTFMCAPFVSGIAWASRKWRSIADGLVDGFRSARTRTLVRYIMLRERVRDRWLILRGVPLYCRCANYMAWKPCRRDADVSPYPDDWPIFCHECDRDPEPLSYRVGRRLRFHNSSLPKEEKTECR